VLIENYSFASHRTSQHTAEDSETPTVIKSLALSAEFSVDVTFRRCNQTNFYALDGMTPSSEYIAILSIEHSKNITVEHCLVTEIIVKEKICNAAVTSSRAVIVDVFSEGTLTLENNYVYSNE